MKIRELPCFLLLLLLVFVDQVHLEVVDCPEKCSRDEETLICRDITNSVLPSLYNCVNVFPDIQVIDIRSPITCDCSLLYLTNHHVNPNLLIFAPVTCPPETVDACGFVNFKKKSNMVEIAGKMFESQDDNLPHKLDKHVEKLVQKLGGVTNSKKRLQYIHAIFLSTKEAVDKLPHWQEKLSLVSTTNKTNSTQGVHIPRYTSNSNPFYKLYTNPHPLSSKTGGYVHQPRNSKENLPFQVHIAHRGKTDDKNIKSKPFYQQPSQITTPKTPIPTIHSWSNSGSYVHQPYNGKAVIPFQVHIPLHTVSVTESIEKSQSTTQTTDSTTSVEIPHPTTTRKRPHSYPHRPPFGAPLRPPFGAPRRPPFGAPRRPPMSHRRNYKLPEYRRPNWPRQDNNGLEEESYLKGFWNLATSTAPTTTESLAEEIRENDSRMKLIIFGSIIAFIVLVITVTLIIINGGKDGDTKRQHGDLDLESFKQSLSVLKKLKSKMQVDYHRRETTGKHTTPDKKTSKARELVEQALQNMPKSNLFKTSGTDAAAVSGLTTAMAQQPVDTPNKNEGQIDKKVKSNRQIGPDGFQTRLIYRDNRQSVMDESNANIEADTNKNHQTQPSNSELSQKPSTSKSEEEKHVFSDASDTKLDDDLFASNLMKKKDVEPTKNPVDLSKLKSKTVVDTSFGTPTSTDGQSSVRNAVKIFQPKSPQDLGRGGRLIGVGDNKFFEVTCNFMDFQQRQKSRAVRKKKLARAQFLA